ncbi:MAG: hypothetical protein HOQ47_15170, partial [Streptomyces sp.]|nr:hypothetical protein [Streptomyces sp.]
LGPVIFLVLAGVVVMFDPLLVLGDSEGSRPAAHQEPAAARKPTTWSAEHAPAPTHSSHFETPASPARARQHPYDTPQRAGEW